MKEKCRRVCALLLALLLLAGCSAVSLPGGLRLSVPLAVCAAFLALPGPDALTAAARAP